MSKQRQSKPATSLSTGKPSSDADRKPGNSRPSRDGTLLHRSIGNRLASRNGPVVQAKLKIGDAHDEYEREADRVADRVMRMPASLQPPDDVTRANIKVQRQCQACEREDEAVIQRKVEPSHSVNTTRTNSGNTIGLNSGTPLGPAERSFFEPRFGTDFGNVRVHAGAQADALSRQFAARAFTYGNNIVFAGGEYRPDSFAGRRLLAHELTHVVQQSGGHNPGHAERISRQADNVIQRTPGVDPEDSWNAVVDRIGVPESAERRQVAMTAKERMLATASGARLINSLWRLFCHGRGNCRARVSVLFTQTLPTTEAGASGYFEPGSPDQPHYNVWVLSRLPSIPDGRSITLGGSWPPGDALIHFTHADPESDMASTLYHEMLHVWFVHAGRQDIGFPTGHGDVTRGEIEPQFLEMLRGFTRELDALEGRLHQEAEQRRAAPEPQPEASPEFPSAPEPRARPEPSIVGGSVFLRGGGFGGGPAGGVGIVGADLTLGRIASFNIGVRGIYLTPQHLLAGGTLGFRLLQEGGRGPGRPVENPLFFDLEAGVLAELPITAAERLTGDAQFLISAGVGQEIGHQGPRFFWRVGGFALVSDEGSVLGGGTAGGGVRF